MKILFIDNLCYNVYINAMTEPITLEHREENCKTLVEP